jgi:ADP-ribose 1''-phosphate phosphatase
MLTYHKGSLFDDKDADVFCHACNCQNVWGSGVAKQLKEKFPWAYSREGLLSECLCPGKATVYRSDDDEEPVVLCLYTSLQYGKERDPADVILRNTRNALIECAPWFDAGTVIASPKINAGLFGVPWEKTEVLIRALCELTRVEWHVWELE